MNYRFILLGLIMSGSALAQPLSPEQTLRQIYQHYTDGSTPIDISDTSENSVFSARMKNSIALNDSLTQPGDVGWLDADPICGCQDFENLVLEKIVVDRIDSTHVKATVSFRVFRDYSTVTTQTLNLVEENSRWLIDDIIDENGSVYQGIRRDNQRQLSAAKKQ